MGHIDIHIHCGNGDYAHRLCHGKSHGKRHWRLVPQIRKIREVAGAVVPTPQYQHPRPHQGRIIGMLQLTATQQCELSVVALDKKGNTAVLQDPTWQADNSELVALTPSGMSCVVAAVGPIGKALVTFRGDGDLGDGVVELLGTLEVEVVAGQAVSVTVTPGTPSEQP